MTEHRDLYELGELPPLGHVPPRMYAQVIRPERFGQPDKAFDVEVVPTPADLRPDEVLVQVMAAGVNYNNVWAGLGTPIDVTKNRPKDPWWPDDSGFHIGGSDASGIVWAVGSEVKDLKVGDPVVIHCGQWRREDPVVQSGKDPMYSPSFRIWGYETSWGSFAQYTRVQAHQCLPKPEGLSWEQAAAYMLVGATAYRMLTGWQPNAVRPGDVALIWGGAGGLGSMAIQIVRELGGTPVAVISSPDKVEFCEKLGAKGCINRKEFSHWGPLPDWKDDAAQAAWAKEAKRFGKAIWDIVGERKNPSIVFEHPGESTVPTSVFVCDTGGMVVICAGTTGYNAMADLRYLWMRQKRLQGSHFANDHQAAEFNQLVVNGRIDPCLTRTFAFDGIPECHQHMYENRHPHGNMACLVGARSEGLGRDNTIG
ncbi:MAG: crotonyl-CoA carboxylase/reductase [Myxococcales bacterium]